MARAALDVKRSTVTRLIRAAKDAGLVVTGVRYNIGRQVELITSSAQDIPPANEWDTDGKD